ncbi:MAG: sigma-E factor negative regulatory protein [Pseudomonadota bacterium]|nr:sigma-E factor negative regulatory protein [Pseudomonadota bacterium]
MTSTNNKHPNGGNGFPGADAASGSEALSSLFDGELDGDASRFVLSRLGHDEAWRSTCGRWQLAGDVLRQRGDALAPPGFAEAVAKAIAEPAQDAAVPVSSVAGASNGLLRRSWLPGVALAASVAAVALMVGNPLSNPAEVASGAVALSERRPQSDPQLPAGDASRAAAGTAAGISAAVVAAVEAPRRRVAVQRAGASPADARRASAGGSPAPASAPTSLPEQAAAVGDAGDAGQQGVLAANPFDLPAGAAPGRPWPRAVLPGYAGGDVFTASFDTVAPAPSFYPFEPDAAKAQAEPLQR